MFECCTPLTGISAQIPAKVNLQRMLPALFEGEDPLVQCSSSNLCIIKSSDFRPELRLYVREQGADDRILEVHVPAMSRVMCDGAPGKEPSPPHSKADEVYSLGDFTMGQPSPKPSADY